MSLTDIYSNTTVNPRLVGFPNIISPLSQNSSSPRISMANHHLSQAMVLDKPEFNKLFTGMENKFIPYTFAQAEREHDCTIVAILPKYRAPVLSRDSLWPEAVVIVLTDEAKPRLDYFKISKYFMGTNGFGFIPEINLRNLQPGNFVSKHDVISRSPGVMGNQFGSGTNLNIIYGSFPETIEDAFVISESGAAKLQTTQISKVVYDCRMDRRPLNLNGYGDVSKLLPDIGTQIRDDGALMGFRPTHWTTVLQDADRDSLREPLVAQDEIIYADAGGTILDIDFRFNPSKLNSCYEQARQYMTNSLQYWRGIYSTYQIYKNQGYKLTKEMHELVNRAIYHMLAADSRVSDLSNEIHAKVRGYDIETDGEQTVDFLQIIVHYSNPRPVANGYKLSDLQGSKGVVGKIVPDDWMPVDDYGIRADMMIDMTSPVARNNPGQLIECGINRISEFVRRECERVYTLKGADPAFDVIMDWYHDINPNQETICRETADTAASRKSFVDDSLKNGIRVLVPPFLDVLSPSTDEHWNNLVHIKSWATKWKVESTPVTYKSQLPDGTIKEFRTKAKFSIGSKYILHLNKIPEIAAPGVACVNNIGIPIKSAYESRYFPVSTSPYRYGEDELRVIAMDTDIREVVRLQGIGANSPVGVNRSIETILTADQPSRIRRIPIPNGELMKTSSVLRLFHNTNGALGVETKNTETTHMDVPAELAEAMWSTDLDEDEKTTPVKPKRKSNNRIVQLGPVEDDIDDEVLADVDDIIIPEEDDDEDDLPVVED